MANCASRIPSHPATKEPPAFLYSARVESPDCVQMLFVTSGALCGFFRLINIQADRLHLLYHRKLRLTFCLGSWENEVKAEQYE